MWKSLPAPGRLLIRSSRPRTPNGRVPRRVGARRNACGARREQGLARSSMTSRLTLEGTPDRGAQARHRSEPDWMCVSLRTRPPSSPQRRAAHRRTRRNARAHRNWGWRWSLPTLWAPPINGHDRPRDLAQDRDQISDRPTNAR
jgi:hypothetical protein